MDHLLRELAPISEEAWSQIDTDARMRLSTYVRGRQLIDFSGPHGWDHSAVNRGGVSPVVDLPETVEPSTIARVEAATRVVQPLAELRVPFTLSRAALDTAARGNPGIDLDNLESAVRAIAMLENSAVAHGWPAAGIEGIVPASAHTPVQIEPATGGPDATKAYVVAVTTAVERLGLAGVGGPYGLALGTECWVVVLERTESGTSLMEHLTRILDGGPIVWAPGIRGGVVVSQRGGDFQFVSGQDLSIGYRASDAESVTLYLEESFTLTILDPTAAVALATGVS